jgi:hypothetical protein
MKRLSAFVILLFLVSAAFAQEYTPENDADNKGFFSKKVISVGAVSGIYIGTLIDSYLIWWRDDNRPFTMYSEDWFDRGGSQGMDKLGHFYTSYLFYKVQKNLFLWGGYSPSTSKLLSGSLTALMALIIEVGDGFSRYGFDYKDFVFNTGGLAYALLQDELPFFHNINFKWSYWPTDGFTFPPRFSDHYEGHIYWMTFNLNGIFSSYWPEYIQPAIGYSISSKLRREYMLGIDINLLPLFRSENQLLRYTGEFINLFHIPSPGIKLRDDRRPEYKLLLLN